ncbi:MAG: gamma-glutamylcyclotransferase [Saprospiraceae bacterium]|nr:gamma-glutamylcyclotransferase [Saprospiraceae bacterium]MCB9318758.1 gamma-glutamylcyclotransferase [Lewinellaceae bacterium]
MIPRSLEALIPETLFVYGTLRLEYTNEAAQRIRAECVYIGQGLIHGKLLDLGNYPGAIFSNEKASWIYGQCFRLPPSSGPLLQFLDDYEGDEYRREVYEVSCWHGRILVMSYHLKKLRDAPVIQHGDWYTYQTRRDSKKLS